MDTEAEEPVATILVRLDTEVEVSRIITTENIEEVEEEEAGSLGKKEKKIKADQINTTTTTSAQEVVELVAEEDMTTTGRRATA